MAETDRSPDTSGAKCCGRLILREPMCDDCPHRDPAGAYRSGDVLPDGSTLLIGNIDPRSGTADRLLDGISVALQEFDTATLLDRVAVVSNEDGWMQRFIREYVEVWR